MTTNDKAFYFDLGRKDFEAGVPCQPTASEELMILIEPQKNNAAPLMAAWIDGWNQAQKKKKA